MRIDRMVIKARVKKDMIPQLKELLDKSTDGVYKDDDLFSHESWGFSVRSDGTIHNSCEFDYERPDVIAKGLAPFMEPGKIVFFGDYSGEFIEFEFDGQGNVFELIATRTRGKQLT